MKQIFETKITYLRTPAQLIVSWPVAYLTIVEELKFTPLSVMHSGKDLNADCKSSAPTKRPPLPPRRWIFSKSLFQRVSRDVCFLGFGILISNS